MLVIDERYAKIILDMESVCISEGIGPDSEDLLREIFLEFPDLAQTYDPSYYLGNN